MVVSVPAVVVVVSCGTVVSGGFVLVVGDVVAPGTLVVPSAGPAPSTHWSLPAIASDHVNSSNERKHIFAIHTAICTTYIGVDKFHRLELH